MAEFVPVEPFNIVIFGGTGDLARRKLLPALFHRWRDGQIHESSRIIGSARSELDLSDYQKLAKAACKDATSQSDWSEKVWSQFEAMVEYQSLDATALDADWSGLKSKLDAQHGVDVFYMATAPRLYVGVAKALDEAGLISPGARIVLEKPIGTDLRTAREINEGVCQHFDEQQIYRIDHYLGKETVQNLMVLRFGNSLFEPVWSRNSIDHVQITVAEELGLEGRADYYDRSGALRDMVQNHLLQLLCLTAMEAPTSLDGDDVRTEKLKVLKALKRFTPNTAFKETVRGQYTAGLVAGKPVKAYREELEGERASDTETFVAIKAEINNWRWAGVPFYLRTGKRMSSRRSEIIIQFKDVPHSIFGSALKQTNRLELRLQPDEGVRLFVQIKEPGPGGLRVKSLPLNLSYAENFDVRYPDAYERLLMDVVRGNLALFMRRDEVEAEWSWVDELIQAWDDTDANTEPYTAGSDGPVSAAVLLDRDGRTWSN